ncbi:MAG: alpha/beta fold hydrolase [Clostridia bacterium]|nr:alpha/beta fold hydrolase [Clostridia bacterium]
MKKLLAIILAVVMVLSLAACGGGGAEPTKKPVTYPKFLGKLDSHASCENYEMYLWNEHTQRKVYGLEWIPIGFNKESGEKLPAIIFVHGNRGGALDFKPSIIELAESGIASFSMECCGANTTPKSDPGEATTSSRASDLDTMFKYVQTLDWIDQDRIYIWGQSHGGMTVMLYAPTQKDTIAGMIVESMSVMSDNNDPYTEGEGAVPAFIPTGKGLLDWYKEYNGDVIISCSVNDAGPHSGGEFTEALYASREKGTAKFYSCPEGGHGINSFSDEGQKITYDAVRALILGE